MKRSNYYSIFHSIKIYSVIALATFIVFLAIGELFLRIKYSEGLSFGNHWGPLVARFERNFQLNRFDGPSRGPEVVGAKGKDGVRILVQGDSITWGQGVRDERSLYTYRLRERLRSINPNVEMAVLAKGGREIDGHLEQILKWGEEIDPDIIVYQWYINDLELDKSHRPNKDRGWRKFVFPGIIIKHSFLWYFLNYRIQAIESRKSYEKYMREYFNKETEGWHSFVEHFRAWAAEAKRLTPNVLLVLHPRINLTVEEPLFEFHTWIEELCVQEGIAIIDLIHPLDMYREDWRQTHATPFDAHPNEAVHLRIAEALHDAMYQNWPDTLKGGRHEFDSTQLPLATPRE